jgi:hypothetical protein
VRYTNSKLKAFRRCKRSYYYKFVEDLVPKTIGEPLRRGTWLHELLEYHYGGGNWRVRHAELTAEFDSLFDEEKDYYGDLPGLCERIFASYVFHYREEDAGLKVIALEEKCEVPMPGTDHVMVFKFDMIAEDENGRWLFEDKSHTKIPGDDYRFLDTQSNQYVWGLNELGTYGHIDGICWNYLRAKPPTIPKLKKNGELSKRKIDTDAYTFLKALKEYGLEPADHRDVLLRLKQGSSTFFRRNYVPTTPQVVKTILEEAVHAADEIERGFLPDRTIDRSCEYCSYKDLCVVDLYQGNRDQLIKLKYKKAEKGDYYGYEEINAE